MGAFNSLFSTDYEIKENAIKQDIKQKSVNICKIASKKEESKKFSRREISFLVDDALSDFKSMYLSPNGFIKKKNFKIIQEDPPDFLLEPSKVN
jgi:hypothetical protein